MAKTFIPDQTSSQYKISVNYGDYVLAADTSISVTLGSAISTSAGAYGNRVTINGSIANGGIYDAGSDTRFKVGATGTINSDESGVEFVGDGGSITNAGSITAVFGISIYGNGVTVSNSGTINGDAAGIITSQTTVIVNKANGIITGETAGIELRYSGGQNEITNAGTISGKSVAIDGSSGTDVIINTGTIDGAIMLDDGNDIFRNNGGTVNKWVYGGTGDDKFYIDRSSIHLSESNGGGWDKVYSSASFTVDGEFEEVFLTGKANAKLIGNDAGTFLTGNTGNNRIVGHLGGDKITGGRGNDILVGDDNQVAAGDGGPDIFIFKNHSGRDIITDFHNGEDSLKLTDYKGFDDFADLKGHIKQVGDNVVITLLDGDQITLRDTLRADINDADFIF